MSRTIRGNYVVINPFIVNKSGVDTCRTLHNMSL